MYVGMYTCTWCVFPFLLEFGFGKSGNLQRLRKRWEEREGENDIPAIGMVFVIIPVKIGVTDGGGSSSLRFGGEGGSPWALKCTQRFLRPFAGKEMCLLCRGVFDSRGGEPPPKNQKKGKEISWVFLVKKDSG